MGHSVKKNLKYVAIAVSSILLLGAGYVVSVTSFDDPISKTLRKNKEPIFIPLGKMKLRVYDNLFSAMNPTPFYAYSEWENRTVSSNQ